MSNIYKCLHCDSEVQTSVIGYDGLGFHLMCNKCESSFDIDVNKITNDCTEIQIEIPRSAFIKLIAEIPQNESIDFSYEIFKNWYVIQKQIFFDTRVIIVGGYMQRTTLLDIESGLDIAELTDFINDYLNDEGFGDCIYVNFNKVYVDILESGVQNMSHSDCDLCNLCELYSEVKNYKYAWQQFSILYRI